nr:hypothetical protein [Tanacetum cinerariifolium]
MKSVMKVSIFNMKKMKSGMKAGYPTPLEAIDRFWRKLNLSPCASLGDDDLGCQVIVEVENFNTKFKKQSRVEVRDVRADGNYGFRAVVVGLKLHENEWPTIQYDLMEELRIYYDHYIVMFGAKECDDVKKRLNFFKNEFAPIEKWMNMPEIGFLIASRYNVIFHNITTLGSMTYMPLRSIPSPWYDHKFITLGRMDYSVLRADKLLQSTASLK